MNDSISTNERNSNTQKAHQRQTFWQITFPLILGILAVSALGVWTILVAVRGGSVSQGADASLVFLIMPFMVMALIPMVLFAGIAFGLIRLKKNLPTAMYKVQQVICKIHDGVRTGTDKGVEPILRLSSTIASIQTLLRKK